LTRCGDDAIVVTPARSRKTLLLFKTIRAFQQRVEYTTGSDGSWSAEFRGALLVQTNASSLEQCRARALDALDEQLAAWITGPTTARPVLGMRRRLNASNKAKRAIAKNR
jgi:hypothetical protein